MIELQSSWGWLVATYLFLGGLGAGVFVAVSVISLIAGDRFKSTVRFGAWISAITIALGTLVLLIDVGKPFRAMIMFKSFVNFESWMTRGAWLLFFAILLNGLTALFWTDFSLNIFGRIWKPLQEKRTLFRAILAIVGIIVNLGVAAYTGILLGVLQFRPLWHTWLLPALFVASALDTGVGLATGYASVREKGSGVKYLRIALEISILFLIAVESVALWQFLEAAFTGSVDAANAAQLLANGPLSIPFWALVVGCGLIIPFLACVSQLSGLLKRFAVTVSIAGLVCCLIGGWTLRFVVLSAGIPQLVASPAWSQILAGIRFLP